MHICCRYTDLTMFAMVAGEFRLGDGEYREMWEGIDDRMARPNTTDDMVI